MFKNRALQVKMVKTEEQNVQNAVPAEDIYINRLDKTKEAVVGVMWEGGKLVAAFLVMDTARKVLIDKTTK